MACRLVLACRQPTPPSHMNDDEPTSQITECGSFDVLRDDLAHPYVNGNKLRKLDAVWPALRAGPARHVVTCGGAQSAHLVAVAALAAGTRGALASHLLVRGEAPAAPTGHALYMRLLGGNVRYVPRREYAARGAMLAAYAAALCAPPDGPRPDQIAVLPEGGAMPGALLGSARLVRWLAGELGAAPRDLVLDCGTGATAAGLALGVALLGLPWRVVGVEVGGPPGEAARTATGLLNEAVAEYDLNPGVPDAAQAALRWVPRGHPRRFGRTLPGDGAAVRAVAAATGVVLDPIWTLAAWEAAAARAAAATVGPAPRQLMLHTGGGLALCGAAQRWPEQY
uniref:Tryptophan synthase beta chain-like PALP domain-containing protein n=2 Tax=Auxenochlorella protothecoides TaxID=3075 RepID=A0A1D2A4Z0_AUXPR